MSKTSAPFSDDLLLPALARAPHALSFLREIVPIDGGDEKLLAHVVEISRRAYEDIDYPCIIMFLHVQFGIAMHPSYPLVEKLAASSTIETHLVALDVGCAFGSDARWLAHHGWKDRVVGCDLKEVLLKHGHALYLDDTLTCGVEFLTGDLFDTTFLTEAATSAHVPGTLTSQSGHVKLLYAASLFHLFSKSDQESLARKLGSLLAPGTSSSPSLILGRQVARPQPGAWAAQAGSQRILSNERWAHNEQSWKTMWMDALQGRKIKVTTSREHFSPQEVEQAKSFRLPDTFFLVWSVEVWYE